MIVQLTVTGIKLIQHNVKYVIKIALIVMELELMLAHHVLMVNIYQLFQLDNVLIVYINVLAVLFLLQIV